MGRGCAARPLEVHGKPNRLPRDRHLIRDRIKDFMLLESHDSRHWSHHLGWATALLLAAILQGIVAWRSALIARDGIDFIRYAQNLPREGRQLIRIKDQHPGYPLMVLGSSVLARPWVMPETTLWIVAARIPPMLFGLGSVIVVWLLTRRLFDCWTADLAALVFAAMPIFRQNAADGLSDSPHMFCYLLAIWMTCEGLTRLSWPWWVGAGAASACGYWIRPEGLLVACVAGGTLLLVFVAWRGREWRRLALCGTALAATVALCALPYPIIAGKLTSKQNPYAQQQPRVPYLVNEALHDSAVEKAEEDAHQTAEQVAPLESQPPATQQAEPTGPPLTPAPAVVAAAAPVPPAAPPQPEIKASLVFKTLGRALYEFGDEIMRGFRFFFLVFYAIGYLEFRHRTLDIKVFVFVYALAILHIMMLLGVFCMSGYISHRHIMPLVALAMPWVAMGIIYTADIFRRLAHLPVSSAALALVLTIVSCAIVIPRAVRELHPGFLPALNAAQWIAAHSRSEDHLLSNSKYVSYFSNRPTVMLNDRTPTISAALAQAGAAADYHYAILDLAEEGYQPAWLDELKSASQPRLEYESIVRGQPCQRVLVLETVPQVAGVPATAKPAETAPRAPVSGH